MGNFPSSKNLKNAKDIQSQLQKQYEKELQKALIFIDEYLLKYGGHTTKEINYHGVVFSIPIAKRTNFKVDVEMSLQSRGFKNVNLQTVPGDDGKMFIVTCEYQESSPPQYKE
jgi:hypothetical protein